MNQDVCQSRTIHQEKIDSARENALDKFEVEEIASTFKVLADPNRLRILTALKEQEMCVCDLAVFVCVSESAVSHQLRLLRTMKLVEYRKEGTVVYYRLIDEHVIKLIDISLEHIRE